MLNFNKTTSSSVTTSVLAVGCVSALGYAAFRYFNKEEETKRDKLKAAAQKVVTIIKTKTSEFS